MNDKSKFPKKIQKELDAAQVKGSKDSLAEKAPKPPKPKHLNNYHHRQEYITAFIAKYFQGYADEIKQQKTSQPKAVGYTEVIRKFQLGSSVAIFDAWWANYINGAKAALSSTRRVDIETPSEALTELCIDAAQQGIEWVHQCQEQIQQFDNNLDRDQDLSRER